MVYIPPGLEDGSFIPELTSPIEGPKSLEQELEETKRMWRDSLIERGGEALKSITEKLGLPGQGQDFMIIDEEPMPWPGVTIEQAQKFQKERMSQEFRDLYEGRWEAQEPAPALGEQELLGEILPEDFERPFNFDPSRRPIEERVNLGPENIVLVRTDEEGKQ